MVLVKDFLARLANTAISTRSFRSNHTLHPPQQLSIYILQHADALLFAKSAGGFHFDARRSERQPSTPCIARCSARKLCTRQAWA